MATFNTVGLNDITEFMLRQDEATMKVVPEMLKAGGSVMQKAQQNEIVANFGGSKRSTGALRRSIKVSAVKEKNGGKCVEVYPDGKDSHGVRNATKGFVLQYGRSNMPARPWFSEANNKAADDVTAEMRRVWEAR